MDSIDGDPISCLLIQNFTSTQDVKHTMDTTVRGRSSIVGLARRNPGFSVAVLVGSSDEFRLLYRVPTRDLVQSAHL